MDQNNQNGQNYQNGQNTQNNQNYQQGQNYQQTQAPAAPVSAPTPTVAPAAPATPAAPAKAKSNKGLIVAIIILAVAIIGACGLFAADHFLELGIFGSDDVVEDSDDDEKEDKKDNKKKKKDDEEDEDPVVVTDDENENNEEEKEESDVESDNVVFENVAETEISVIELFPDRVVAKRDLETFAGLIEERAKVLGDNYAVEYDGSKITLTIEKALLGANSAERAHTAELLVSRGNVNFGTRESEDYYSPSKDNISSVSVVELSKTDVLMDYSTGMMDDRYTQLDLIKEDTIYGLEIAFTRDGQSAMENVLKYEYDEPKMTVIHDYLEENSYETKHFFASMFFVNDDDMSSAYLISPGASYEKNAQVMKKILEQDHMDFGLVMDIKDEPAWETSGRRMGRNQKTSMTNGNLVAEWTPDDYTRSYRSEVEFAEYAAVLKKRMDALGIDYMFGTSGFDDKTYCIRVSSEDLAPDFFRLIFADKETSVRSTFSNLYGFYYTPEIIKENGTYALRMKSYNTKEELKEEAELADNTKVYLVVNDVTIASANIDDAVNIDNGYSYIDFKDFLCFGGITVGEEEENVLNLICSIFDESYMGVDGTLNFRVSGMEDTENLSLGNLDWKYSSLTSEDERVLALLEGKCYNADKFVDKRNMLVIVLDIPVNDNLPENFINKVKELYTLCGFDSGAYNEITFVIKDEKTESPANEFNFVVTKDTYDGKMEVDENVSGPKFWDYWYDVYTMMEEDPFFQERSW